MAPSPKSPGSPNAELKTISSLTIKSNTLKLRRSFAADFANLQDLKPALSRLSTKHSQGDITRSHFGSVVIFLSETSADVLYERGFLSPTLSVCHFERRRDADSLSWRRPSDDVMNMAAQKARKQESSDCSKADASANSIPTMNLFWPMRVKDLSFATFTIQCLQLRMKLYAPWTQHSRLSLNLPLCAWALRGL